jgi:2-dehydropantoate 2-reductase
MSRLFQPTTFGQLDGDSSQTLKDLVRMFKRAGFPVAISSNMDAWQKTHVALVSPIANSLYMVGDKASILASTAGALHLMVRAIRECLHVLRLLQVPITPPWLQAWEWIPESVLVSCLRLWIRSSHFENVAAHHAIVARDEMEHLAKEFKTLSQKTAMPTPCMDKLASYFHVATTKTNMDSAKQHAA